jgi:hypothetical protein
MSGFGRPGMGAADALDGTPSSQSAPAASTTRKARKDWASGSEAPRTSAPSMPIARRPASTPTTLQ